MVVECTWYSGCTCMVCMVVVAGGGGTWWLYVHWYSGCMALWWAHVVGLAIEVVVSTCIVAVWCGGGGYT